MDKISAYFEHISSLHRTLILAGGITFFWMVESVAPLFYFKYNKWKHAAINLFFTITTLIVNFFFAVLIVFASDWCLANKFGFLQWIIIPLWLQLVLGLLLLDLIGAYTIHFIAHKIKWIWKFHVVHHADKNVDTTTANRHHPGESIFRAVFAVIAIFICGAPVWLVMLYQSLSVLLSQFNHANIKIPERIDKILRLIIISPNMHKVHHHFMRPETDSNYGNIFSCWDRLFGTYRYLPMSQLKYGLDVFGDRNDENLFMQLNIPFDKSIKTDY